MASHWSLNDSKSPQISRTLLSILADLNKAVVWMVSTHPLISKSFSPCVNLLIDCSKSTNYNWYRCHFHVPQFFQFSSKIQVLIKALFCAVIRRDLVYFLKFSFLSHGQVFSYEMSLVCHLKCLYS